MYSTQIWCTIWDLAGFQTSVSWMNCPWLSSLLDTCEDNRNKIFYIVMFYLVGHHFHDLPFLLWILVDPFLLFLLAILADPQDLLVLDMKNSLWMKLCIFKAYIETWLSDERMQKADSTALIYLCFSVWQILLISFPYNFLKCFYTPKCEFFSCFVSFFWWIFDNFRKCE